MAGVMASTAGGVKVVVHKRRQVSRANDAVDQYDHWLVLGDGGGSVVGGAPGGPVIVAVLGARAGNPAVEPVVTRTSECGAQRPVPGPVCGGARLPGQQ